MIDILNLALPYFGLIFVGFACGRWKRLPENGLAWMNFFLLYVSLPALFFRIMSKTPFEELNNLPFVLATTLATMLAFGLSALVGRLLGKLSIRDATMAGLAGGYGNIGYMGPGLALAVLGAKAAVPTALIFCFDSIFLFSIVPLVMALTSGTKRPLLPTIAMVVREIVLHPLIVAAYCGALAAALHLKLPVAVDGMLLFLQNAAAPVALFVLGVTVALRPFGRVPWEVPGIVVVKLLLHPLLVFGLLLLFGPFTPEWAATALLMASLPPALNVFVIARQYNTWVEPASVAVLIGTFVSVLSLTTVMWLISTGQIAF
ncbi:MULTISPECIES: AEC family transporter [Rhodopseudomonas]|uniref:Malonate transporter n=1 Tax=Rhodopseudomonas palustris TaxID=1076 RepID=A0A0D7F1B7_RHOPL|nr:MULTISPECIES: AEC family transporter [Rhodopseudomonas]KIZ45497.1 malonate transporter [Rhodopseudomonas palustris]MDF3814452.1 AEC family transporter [Rhodopseudomonas sp. BAL398]WOK18885.1 AEC family transporter [Rhodopseudomonas sp. BAL398]